MRWLYLDFNSYFASVEQQDRPELRGRPVIVVPLPSEHTCAIAASPEAKRLGIKTGAKVREARALCPDLRVVPARPERYVQVHHQVLAEIDRHIPVTRVCSIDEAACALMGPERGVEAAQALARRIKQGLRETMGSVLTASIGLAPSRMLAKTAADMNKPDGLTLLRLDALPGPLLGLPISDMPGVGRRMQARLQAAGVRDMADLWALSGPRARALWGGIEGERFRSALHGVDPPEIETRRACVSHGHILAPQMRTPERARAVARRLLAKAAVRLRRMDHVAGALTLSLDTRTPVNTHVERRFAPVADTFALLDALGPAWDIAIARIGAVPIRHVGVTLHRLAPRGEARDADLFGWAPGRDEDPRRMSLTLALDRLSERYGKDVVSIGPVPAGLPEHIGAKIAFNHVPDLKDFKEPGAAFV